MTLTDALAVLAPLVPEETVCVYANGFLSRAGCAARDRDECFYMIGSMGLASSIGLGLALVRPHRRVLVLDGDGNVLMNPGALASIAAARPANLVHVCFDNGVHASTGGQRTIADRVALDALARAAGYPLVERVDTAPALREAIGRFLAASGPAFLHVKIALGPAGAPGKRVPYAPEAMAARMRRALGVEP
jgi:thiamine pyrophosphate-dependent acetolactate synthase large subunit-like protein